MTSYVLGFLFSLDKKHVALIRKNKPEWQKGKLNGIGGKIEPGESPLDAMIREFREETGAVGMDWQPFADVRNLTGDVCVHCFVAYGAHTLTSTTDELVAWTPVNKLEKIACIPNLRWLVPLALDQGTLHVNATFA